MNKLFLTVILFVMGSFVIRAQDETAGELIIWVKNNPGGAEIKIEVSLVSSLCWDAWNSNYDLHDITNLYNGSYLTTSSTLTKDLNWEACWSVPGYQYGFGLGNYKVTAYQKINGEFEQKDYFYIDYRTSDLPENFNSGGQGDLSVDFNVGSGVFYYYGTQNLFPTTTSIWAQKNWIDNITTELEPKPPTNLIQTASSGSPHLQWQHASVSPNWRTGYKIYRSIASPSNFVVIGSVSANTNTFIDNSVLLGGGGPAYYKVTAINGTRESVFSNTIYVIVNMAEKIKLQDEINIESYYRLDQNFPNPFNPSTKITFTLRENSFVTLKVFDILGKEVAVLINEVLIEGNHQVEFNGSNLESGIYFYEIRANDYRDVKKLILLK